jgi:putative membrane protein
VNVIVKLVIRAFALWATVQLVPGLAFEGNLAALVGIAIVFAVVNTLVKPLVAVLSLPLILVTFGLFYLVVNWLMFGLVVWLSGPAVLDLGLTSESAVATFIGAMLMSIISLVVAAVIDRD